MHYGTKSSVVLLPTFIKEGKWVIFTSGNIAAGKDQAGMLIANCLWYDYRLTSIEIDPDRLFPKDWNPATDDPNNHFEDNREKAFQLFIKELDNYIEDRVIIFQSGGATLDGEYGRRTMVQEALNRGYRVLHLLLDTPEKVCEKRNENRRRAGKRYTRKVEFDRCVANVTKNFVMLSRKFYGDGTHPHFDLGELYNVGMRLRYITVKKYQIITTEGKVVPVYYHWNSKTDDPYLTKWNPIKAIWYRLLRK